EYKNLTPRIEAFRRYKDAEKAMKEAEELMQEGDADLKELAEAEFYEMRDLLEKLSAELKVLLLPKDENDDKNVIVEIRGGAGGEEAALFASVLYRMYGMYADKMGFKIEPLNVNETELGGIKEISFMVVGDGAYSKLKFESGVHRVQRVPETESQGRIHTSTVTVAVLPEADDVEVEINPADLKIETCKSSGAGGQHVNKTESAIRIIHKPSGIIVECQEERSQFKNRDKAMKMLKTKLLDIKQREQDDKIASARKSQVGTGDRSERIRTYNYPQGRVTDHRIGLTLYTLESFLNGDISQMIDELIAADTAEKLKESVDEN
ncbi:MAG: peptide chain release factor 1, partial [Clostridia bacterium]|nr:peptide chain release factor 1 [Clostridia bacterium]